MDKQRMAEFKEQLTINIENTAWWRAQKAEEYPDDAARNLTASEALTDLATYVEALPDDHSLFMQMVTFCENHENTESEVEEENSLIRGYGFQMEALPEMFIKRLGSVYA